MKTYKLDEFTRGWIYGNFEPSIQKSEEVEVGLLSFKANEFTRKHFHKEAVEINVVVSGLMHVDGKPFGPGDIFVIEQYETVQVSFYSDTQIMVVKSPSLPQDKYYVD